MGFPEFIVLKASAGSGKTHALTKRYAAFLLSEAVPRNGLRNIVAITFANNAAKEMKQRVIEWLKKAALADADVIEELASVPGIQADKLQVAADARLGTILTHYADLQVKTIDSFMASVFSATALEFGYAGDFEILLDNREYMRKSFELFCRDVSAGSPAGGYFESMIDIIQETVDTFIWDPTDRLLKNLQDVHQRMTQTIMPLTSPDLVREKDELIRQIGSRAGAIERAIVQSGLAQKEKGGFVTICKAVKSGNHALLLDAAVKSPPVNKDKKKPGEYDAIVSQWNELAGLVCRYVELHCRSYYAPYVELYNRFEQTMSGLKRRERVLFIEDINRLLLEKIKPEAIPDIYFLLGETIAHYLVDEFQDTSPIQWENLKPLIENSLAEGGSLFVVGDMKQAIYGFRNADYRIMRQCIERPLFPSVAVDVQELEENHRSAPEIVDFAGKVFKQNVPADPECGPVAHRSGLTDYVQRPSEKQQAMRGYVETVVVDAAAGDGPAPAQDKILAVIDDLRERGYRCSDIAILAHKNNDVLTVTSWLSGRAIEFISLSSLDIRKRAVIRDILALLAFLDAPVDDLAFGSFLRSDMFLRASDGLTAEAMDGFMFANRARRPLYKAFQQQHAGQWEQLFADLFRSVGYQPLYDLVSDIYRAFDLFASFPAEEAALARFLELIKEFEGTGTNTLKDFLATEEDEDDDGRQSRIWDLSIPKNTDAVTVMTLFKAKGLQFPVVICLLYEEDAIRENIDVVEERDGAVLVRVTGNQHEKTEFLKEVYTGLRSEQRVSRLNALYVELTRARNELYVVAERKKPDSVKLPLSLLPAAEYQPRDDKPAAVSGGKGPHGAAVQVLHVAARPGFPVREGRGLRQAEKRRGDFLHAVLSRIEYLDDDLTAQLQAAVAQASAHIAISGTPAGLADKAVESLAAFLRLPEVAPCFSRREGRQILCEQEIVDRDGAVSRMDRIIVDSDAVTVIDYKTGTDSSADKGYEEQIGRYRALLAQIYPDKSCSGAVAYIDRMLVKSLS